METKIVRNPEKIKQQLGMFAAVFISAKVLRDKLNRDVDDLPTVVRVPNERGDQTREGVLTSCNFFSSMAVFMLETFKLSRQHKRLGS